MTPGDIIMDRRAELNKWDSHTSHSKAKLSPKGTTNALHIFYSSTYSIHHWNATPHWLSNNLFCRCAGGCALPFNSRSIQWCARDRRPMQRIRCFRGAECSSVIIEASEEQLNINLNSDYRANSAMVQNLTFRWLHTPATLCSPALAPSPVCHSAIQWPLLMIFRRVRRFISYRSSQLFQLICMFVHYPCVPVCNAACRLTKPGHPPSEVEILWIFISLCDERRTDKTKTTEWGRCSFSA